MIYENLIQWGIQWIGLESEYRVSASKLSLKKIDCGHEFKRSYNAIMSGKRSCPICVGNIGENKCREIFNNTFGDEFKKVRSRDLPWLVNYNGRSLELDGYCESLKMAFEYGSHDFFFGASEQEVAARKNNDKLKIKLCDKYGIRLYQIKEKTSIWDQILRQSAEFNIIVPLIREPEIDFSRIYISASKTYMIKVFTMANELGYKIISNHNGMIYRDMVELECLKRGHRNTFDTNAIISRGLNCEKCYREDRAIHIIDLIIQWMKKHNDQKPKGGSKNRKEARLYGYIGKLSQKNIQNIYPSIINKLDRAGYSWLLEQRKVKPRINRDKYSIEDIDTKQKFETDNLFEFCKKHNIIKQNVYKVLKNERKHAGRFTFTKITVDSIQ